MSSALAAIEVGGDVIALYWVSNVFLWIGAIVFIAGGMGILWDGTANIAQIGAIDPVLKGVTKANCYELFSNCQDEKIKHMGFWMILQMRSWGAFQCTCGAAVIVVSILVPIHARAAAHFVYAALDFMENLIELSTGFGLPTGVDPIAKFGGVSASATAPEGGSSFASGPIRKAMKGSYAQHLFFGVVHTVIAIFCLTVKVPYGGI